MSFDPKLIFWLTFAAMLLQGFVSGAVHLTGLVPMEMIPAVTAWIGLANFIVLTFLTVATGTARAGPGPLAPKPTVEEAQKIMDVAKGAGK